MGKIWNEIFYRKKRSDRSSLEAVYVEIDVKRDGTRKLKEAFGKNLEEQSGPLNELCGQSLRYKWTSDLWSFVFAEANQQCDFFFFYY